MQVFGPPETIARDNASCLTAKYIESYMRNNGITWRRALAYAPMSNGRADQIVGTLKRSIKKIVLDEGVDCEVAMRRALFGYNRRLLKSDPFLSKLLYKLVLRLRSPISATDTLASGSCSTIVNRRWELLAIQSGRATPAVNHATRGTRLAQSAYWFTVSDNVLIAYRRAQNSTVKWPAFQFSYYGL